MGANRNRLFVETREISRNPAAQRGIETDERPPRDPVSRSVRTYCRTEKFMKLRIPTLWWLAAATAVSLVATGALDIEVGWRNGEAHALDLFGSSSDEKDKKSDKAGAQFWQQGSGKPPMVPIGVPASFAALGKSSPGLARRRRSGCQYTRTCSDIAQAISWPMTDTIPERFSTT